MPRRAPPWGLRLSERLDQGLVVPENLVDSLAIEGRDLLELGIAQVHFRYLGSTEAHSKSKDLAEVRGPKVGSPKLGAADPTPPQNRPLKLSPGEVHSLQMAISKLRSLEFRLLEVGYLEMAGVESCGAQASTAKIGSFQVAAGEIGLLEVRSRQIRMLQPQPAQVDAPKKEPLQADPPSAFGPQNAQDL